MDSHANLPAVASLLPDYQNIFNARGESYNEACRAFQTARETERALLIDLLDVMPQHICCDAPAGGGFLAEGLEQRQGSYEKIICLEPAQGFLQGIPPRFPRVRGSLTMFPLASGMVDRIGSLAGLHHIPRKLDVFHEAFRVLTPGGKFAVADVQDGTAVGAFLNEAVDHFTLTGHKGLFFRKNELASLMTQAGFSDVSERYEQFTWNFPDFSSLIWYCQHLFGMVKATSSQVEKELRARFTIDCSESPVRLPWSLVYAVGTKPAPGNGRNGSNSLEKPDMQDAQRENGRQCPLPHRSQQYWDHVGQEWSDHAQERVWRAHSDAVNTKLFMNWLGQSSVRRLLKTDLFDEAVNEGLWDFLRSRADVVVGMDVSLTTLRRASSTQPDAAVVCADVRRLPFAGDSFDAVISNSTLDHFQKLSDMAASLKEFSRIVRPGGHLVLTIDNLANPVIALRNILPFQWLHRLGLLPYYVGATCGPDRLRRMLEDAGLRALASTAILHCPRVFGVHAGRWLHTYGTPSLQSRFGRWLMKWECLARWPTRYMTGHFIAIHCQKPEKNSR